MKLDQDMEDRSKRYFGKFYPRLKEHKVLVIGAGAVGTEVIKNLVMAGVENIHLVDFDKVSLSNLNRCVFFRPDDHDRIYKVEAIAREIKEKWKNSRLKTYAVKIQEAPEDIWDVPLVIVAVDNNEARYYTNLRILSNKNIPFVINGATGRSFLEIQVMKPDITPCILCSWRKEYFERLINKMVRETCDEFFFQSLERFPAISILNSLAGAIMSGEAIKILIGLERWREEKSWEEDHVPLLGKSIHYDIREHEFFVGKMTLNPNCVEVFCRSNYRFSPEILEKT